MFEVGDYVYWKAYAGKLPIERAGQVIGIVPPNTSISMLVPLDIFCRNTEVSRPEVSYLIKVYGIPYAFWPNAAHLFPLTDDKLYVLDSQPKSGTHYILRKVDKTDRIKMRELAVMLKDAYTETKDMIEVRAWHTRFWFEVSKGVEFISSIDRW